MELAHRPHAEDRANVMPVDRSALSDRARGVAQDAFFHIYRKDLVQGQIFGQAVAPLVLPDEFDPCRGGRCFGLETGPLVVAVADDPKAPGAVLIVPEDAGASASRPCFRMRSI